MQYVLINKQTNVVENVIVLENADDWTPPENMLLMPLVGEYGMGCIWDGFSFSLPPEKEQELEQTITSVPTRAELLAQLEQLQIQIQLLT